MSKKIGDDWKTVSDDPVNIIEQILPSGLSQYFFFDGERMVDDLKEYAEKYYSDSEFETLKEKYTFAKPFTKESLLYREIFEEFYPKQAKMVKPILL